MIVELESKVAVFLNERSLRAAIKKIHQQYNTLNKRVLSGNQKQHSLAFTNYTLCSFLKATKDYDLSKRKEKIQVLSELKFPRLEISSLHSAAGFLKEEQADHRVDRAVCQFSATIRSFAQGVLQHAFPQTGL